MSDDPVRILFHALARSDDLRYLSNREADALRELAVRLGEDPDVATPDHRKRLYPHAYRPLTNANDIDAAFGIRRVVAVKGSDGWTTERNDQPAPYAPCGVGWPWCAKPEDDPIHRVAEDERLSA